MACLPLRLFVLFCVCLVAAQARSQSDESFTLDTQLVNIDVMVRDKRGRFVTDLQASDFVVTEDGVPQRVEFFDPPLAASNSTTAGAAHTLRRAAKHHLARAGRTDDRADQSQAAP
jgi:hypothetical protein